jgi:hypothetical protein
VFVFTIFVEHLILLMKQFVAKLVPDTPGWVEVERAHAEMRKEALLHTQAVSQKRARLEAMESAKRANAGSWERADEDDNDTEVIY